MNRKSNRLVTSCLIALTSIALTACGESDLVELQERQLGLARNAAAQEELGAAQPVESEQGVDLNAYSLVFNDEFRATTLDSNKWNTSLSWGPDLVVYNQMQYFVDIQNNTGFGYNPFSLDGEILTISATETPDALRSAANEQPWLSGVLTTAGKYDFTYGYIEASINTQAGRGLWPAFWMLSSEFEDLRPELFVMENDGSRPDSIFHNYNYTDADGNLRSPGQWEVTSPELSDGFNKVGVVWSPQELLFYINDVPSYRIVGENVGSQDMYLILSLAVGGIWPGAPDGTTPVPSALLVDYVRVYQLNE